MKIFEVAEDRVIQSKVAMGSTTYRTAIEKLYPLLNRFPDQRKTQSQKFYARLKSDILDGCLMPPITIAFVTEQTPSSAAEVQTFVNQEISSAYILDGIQRLNTMWSANQEDPESFPNEQTLFINVILAQKKDMLLYRMITLNNGQRPMTPRHQIEVLTKELFDFRGLNMEVQTERERAEGVLIGSFNLSDISLGYLAFVTSSIHNENSKIISEKMDEIIVGRILDSNFTKESTQFHDVLSLIDRFCEEEKAKSWFKVSNNLIAFCAGARKTFGTLQTTSTADFVEFIRRFEEAFSIINISKVTIGRYRRELAYEVIANFTKYLNVSSETLSDTFAQMTAQ